jgi:hypothetical protein
MSRTRCSLAPLAVVALVASVSALAAPAAEASSHREAPFVATMPAVDATDFYMFASYEPGRQGFVTLIADYIPLQDPYGGPNYFSLDPRASYRIHVDNTGDGIEDVSFVFRPISFVKDVRLPVGGEMVSIPLVKAAPGTFTLNNRVDGYSVSVVRGEIGSSLGQPLVNLRTGGNLFGKPYDNIGAKTFPDYAGYARLFVTDVGIPGCGDGRVFVGQRKDPFVVNLGETFDLINIANPVGPRDAETDSLAGKNVTALALEVPIDCLTDGGAGDVVGGWTTAALPRNRELQTDPSFEAPTADSGGLVQVSRLGMPLVNEVVIGLPDKNRFNASRPDGDARFATYVTNPTLPEVIELLFGVEAPNNFPRADLVAAFVTGIPGINQLGFGEMQRLNTSVPPTPKAQQSDLGLFGGDNAGFPNGRRPGDDVVDIELRAAMGAICHAFPGVFCSPADAPAGNLPFTDGALVDASFFDNAFPYLRTPLPGSPQ